MLTGQRRNKANNVSFSNKKSRKWQELNLRRKKIYWSGGQRIVSLRISARTIKTIEKNGLLAMASKSGTNLWKLPFQDARPQRKDFLNEKPMSVPRAKNCKKKLKNPVRLAHSRKRPMIPCYIDGSIFWIREGEEQNTYKLVKARKDAELAGRISLRSSEATVSESN